MEAVKYAECRKSHLRYVGWPDGCQEYNESTSSPLNCEICGCHRNFHRKVEVAAALVEEEPQVRHEKEVLVLHGDATAGQGSSSSPISPVLAEKSNTNDLINGNTFSFFEGNPIVKELEEELECDYDPETVAEVISSGLKELSPFNYRVLSLPIDDHLLFHSNVVNAKDIASGFLLHATSLCDLATDNPKALDMFGEIIGNLVMRRSLDFKVFNETLDSVEDIYYREAIFTACMRIVYSYPDCGDLLKSQGSDVAACKDLF